MMFNPTAGSQEQYTDSSTSLADVEERVVSWAFETFPDSTFAKMGAHLAEEGREYQREAEMAESFEAFGAGSLMYETARANGIEELADCWMIACHAKAHAERIARICGINLAAAASAKLEKNRARTWAHDSTTGYVKHVGNEESH